MSCRFSRSIGRGKWTLVEEEVITREGSGRAGETEIGLRCIKVDYVHGTAMAGLDVVNVVMQHRRGKMYLILHPLSQWTPQPHQSIESRRH
jgi:hypothetical protein